MNYLHSSKSRATHDNEHDNEIEHSAQQSKLVPNASLPQVNHQLATTATTAAAKVEKGTVMKLETWLTNLVTAQKLDPTRATYQMRSTAKMKLEPGFISEVVPQTPEPTNH